MKRALTYTLVAIFLAVTGLAQSLHRIKEDVLAAYSKADFTEMMSMFAIHDTKAVKQMVDAGKVVGIRKGSEVYLENIDVISGIAEVKPKGSTITVWIPSDFVE